LFRFLFPKKAKGVKKRQNVKICLQKSQIGNPAALLLIETRDYHWAGVLEWTLARVWIFGRSRSRCQAKFLTSAKFLICYCFSVVLIIRIKK